MKEVGTSMLNIPFIIAKVFCADAAAAAAVKVLIKVEHMQKKSFN